MAGTSTSRHGARPAVMGATDALYTLVRASHRGALTMETALTVLNPQPALYGSRTRIQICELRFRPAQH